MDGYTDMGQGTVCLESGGCYTAEQWVATDSVFNVTMETDQLYVVGTDASPAPLIDVDTLTPFGEYVGQSNTTYLKYAGGPQASSWFNVSGLSSCQRSSNCNSNVRQLHRLATGKKNLWLQSHLAAKLEAAQAQVAAAKGQLAALATRAA